MMTIGTFTLLGIYDVQPVDVQSFDVQSFDVQSFNLQFQDP
jgi:hypothetical protein